MNKTKLLIVATLIIGFISSTNASTGLSIYNADKTLATGNFGRFHGHRQQTGVGLSWTMNTDEAIAGFLIERSYDGVYFDEIGEMSSNSTNRYRYMDSFVFPGFIHYRITAIYANGSTETSETIIVHIVSKK